MSTVSAVECVKQCANERTACRQHRDLHYRRVIKNCHSGKSRENYVHCEHAPDDLADARSADKCSLVEVASMRLRQPLAVDETAQQSNGRVC